MPRYRVVIAQVTTVEYVKEIQARSEWEARYLAQGELTAHDRDMAENPEWARVNFTPEARVVHAEEIK